MANNKNQHFVPRCYLRAFTAGGENKAIDLYNINRDLLIRGAPVKNQCSGDYFYGHSQLLENAILHVESAYGAEAKPLISSSCDILTRRVAIVLRSFWVLQYLRTEAASIRSAQMSHQMANAIGEELQGFAMSIKEAVQLAMGAYVDQLRVTDDLAMCIVRNASGIPFFTSDDPAVLTNRLHFHRRWHVTRSFGIGSVGMIGLLPLSKELLCVLYDPKIYEMQSVNGFVETCEAQDVIFVNEHQILNCHANLYVRDVSEESLNQMVKRVKPHRVYPRTQVTYSVRDGEDNGYVRYRVVPNKDSEPHLEALIHTRQSYAEPSGWPSFLHWKHRGFFFVAEEESLRRGPEWRYQDLADT